MSNVYETKLTVDISQVESALRRLAALQSQTFGATPPINLPQIAQPITSLQGLNPQASLASIAQIQGAMEGAITKMQQLGALSKEQAAEQRALIGPATGGQVIPVTGTRGAPEARAAFLASNPGISEAELKEAGSIKRESILLAKSEQGFQLASNQATEESATLGQQIAATKAAQLTSEEVAAAATAKRAETLQTQITVLQEELGIDTDIVALKTQSLSELAITLNQLKAQKIVQRELTQAPILGAGAPAAAAAKRAAELEVLASQDMVKAKAVEVVDQRQRTEALNKAVAEELASRGYGRVAQKEALLGRYGQSGAPTDAGGLLGAGAITTLKYAIPSAVLFGGLSGLKTSIKEAQDLQKVFNQIQEQFKGLGRADEFQGFRDKILDIASSSGTAASEVAHIGFQLQGAFGGDTQRALAETQNAIEAVKVTGLSLTETIDSFTALTQSFKDQNVTIAQVTDTALGLQERFGVLAKETISFSADLAPVGQAAGFTVRQLEILGAVSQKYSGLAGSKLAESFGRVIPQLQKDSVKLIDLFSKVNPDVGQEIGRSLAVGDTASAFIDLIKHYKDLNQAQKNYFIELVGGRREAQAVLSVFENSDDALKELNRTQSDAGKTQEYYTKLQDTLAQTMSRLGETLKQIGVNIFESGLGDFLTALASGAAIVGDVLKELVGVLSSINDLTGGLTSNILGVGAAFLVVAKGLDLLIVKFGLLTVATEADTVAEAENATAVNASIASRIKQAGANAIATVSQGAIAGATGPGAYAAAPANLSAAFAARPLGAAAGAAGGIAQALGPLTYVAAAVGIVELGKTIEDQRKQIKAAATSLYEQAIKKPAADLQKLIDDPNLNSNVWASVGTFLSGQKAPKDVLRDAQQEQNEPAREAGLKAVQDRIATYNDEQLQAIISALASSGLVGIDSNQYTALLNPDSSTADKKTQIKAALDEAIAKLKKDPKNDGLVKAFEGFQEVLGTTDSTISNALNTAYSNTQKSIQENLGKQSEGATKAQQAIDRIKQSPDIDALAASYKAGTASLNAYQSALRESIKNVQEVIDGLGAAGIDIDPNLKKSLDEMRATEAKLTADVLTKTKDIVDDFKTSTGTNSGQQQIDADLALLRNPDFTDRDSRLKVAQDLVKTQKTFLQDAIDNAKDITEAKRLIKEGMKIPPEVQQAIYASLLDPGVNSEAGKFFDDLVAQFGGTTEEFKNEVAKALSLGQDARNALAEQLTQQLLQLRIGVEFGNGGANAQVIKAMDDLQSLIEQLKGGGDVLGVPVLSDTVGFDPADQKKKLDEQNKKAKELASAKGEFYKALYGDDPVVAAQIDLQVANETLAGLEQGTAEWYQAQAQVANAQKALKNAEQAITKAWMGWYAALDAGDPVKSAKDAQAAADFAYANAKNESDRINAAAQRIAADRQLADAISAIVDAQTNLLIAIADAGGNLVESSNLSLKEAQRKLAETQAKFQQGAAGQADVINAQAAVVQAQARLRDTRLSEQKEQYEFLYDMGKITKTQLIAYLQQLKSIPDLTAQQMRDLDREIKSLKGELQQDLQFNLPTNIDLPTLYEVRRLNQTTGPGGAGVGYQDNRVVSIDINVNTPSDRAFVEKTIGEALSTNRYGNEPRRY